MCQDIPSSYWKFDFYRGPTVPMCNVYILYWHKINDIKFFYKIIMLNIKPI